MQPARVGLEVRRRPLWVRLTCVPFHLGEDAAFDYPSPCEPRHSRYPQPHGEMKSLDEPEEDCLVEPCRRLGAESYKKRTLCCNLQTVERMEEIFNTGSRKHDVSYSGSLSPSARCSRGQVQREFINSLLSVANWWPGMLEKKALCYQSPRWNFGLPARWLAPRGVAL